VKAIFRSDVMAATGIDWSNLFLGRDDRLLVASIDSVSGQLLYLSCVFDIAPVARDRLRVRIESGPD